MNNTSSKHKTVSELSGSKLYFAVTICVFCQVIAMAGEPRKLSSFNGDFGTLVAAVLPHLDLFVRPLALECKRSRMLFVCSVPENTVGGPVASPSIMARRFICGGSCEAFLEHLVGWCCARSGRPLSARSYIQTHARLMRMSVHASGRLALA